MLSEQIGFQPVFKSYVSYNFTAFITFVTSVFGCTAGCVSVEGNASTA